MINQMDFVFFAYGFSFLVLTIIALNQGFLSKNLSVWKWLAAFGLIHGFSEWSVIVGFCVGESVYLEVFRLLLTATSFLCLYEFGRSHLKHKTGLNIPWWICPSLLPLASLGGLVDVRALDVTCRYFLGIPSALLAGWSLIQGTSKQPVLKCQCASKTAGIILAIYGISTGLIVNKTTLPLSAFLNQEIFLSFTGIHIQWVRTLCISVVALGIWCYCYANWTQKSRISWMKDWSIVGFIVILLTGGFWMSNWRGNLSDMEQRNALLAQAQALMAIADVEEHNEALMYEHESKVRSRLRESVRSKWLTTPATQLAPNGGLSQQVMEEI